MFKSKLIGYVNTNDLQNISILDIKALDIINIAFGEIIDNKVIWNEESAKKDISSIYNVNPNIKILLSIGGWSSGNFSEASANKENRASICETAIEIIEKYSIDGIDLDWEYPSYTVAGISGNKEDKINFTLLLEDLRNALNLVNEQYMLTIAAGGGEYYLRGVNMEKAIQYLDYVQLMTYDLRGGFQVLTGHHTPLYESEVDLFEASVDTAVKCFMQAGVPNEKIVIGVAFYSRMWNKVPNIDNGLIQIAQTTGGYGPSYGELVEKYIDKNGYKRYWDNVSKAPYLFNGDTFISYDDEKSIRYKIEYMKEKKLYGIMYWEYKTDETKTLTCMMKKEIENNVN